MDLDAKGQFIPTDEFHTSIAPTRRTRLERGGFSGGAHSKPLSQPEYMLVRRVIITPTRLYAFLPQFEQTNRVLRRFSDCESHFLRVAFVDEDLQQLPSRNTDKIRRRKLNFLTHGVVLGGRRYQFLGFSASQLRQNALWFFAPKGDITADTIRSDTLSPLCVECRILTPASLLVCCSAWLGSFDNITNIATYAARIGQNFSTTTPLRVILPSEAFVIPDVTYTHPNGYDSPAFLDDGFGCVVLY